MVVDIAVRWSLLRLRCPHCCGQGCALAAVVEQLIGNRLADADLRDPDLDEQHLSADRAFQELDRIRQVTFTAGEQTITAVTRRTGLQQQILTALQVDTAAWTRPTITG